MLIDKSYFAAGPRHILNVTLGQGTTLEDHTVNSYISEFQELFLWHSVGVKVGNMINEYLEQLDNNADAETDPKIEAVCSKLRKPFADFVFYHIIRSSNHQATVTGTVKLKSANEMVSPIILQVQTWNRMANHLNIFAEWVDEGSCPIDGIVIDNNLLTPINRFNL